MNHIKNLGISLLTVAVMVFGSAAYAHCGGCGSDNHAAKTSSTSLETKEEVVAKKNIVETAIAAGDFKTLVAAVEAADLAETLTGDGPFTVFAPTDAAFAKLPEGTIEALLKDQDKLSSILTYHVVPSQVTASEVVKLTSAKTANGQEVSISANDEGVTVGGANVLTTDIICSNGVIHIIDEVLLPN